MSRGLLVALIMLSLGACASPQKNARFETPALRSALLGHWEGVARDGATVGYVFRDDGSVLWQVAGSPSILARYEVRRAEALLEIDIFGFTLPQFEGVRFLGIAELSGDRMKFFGVPTKEGRTENGAPAVRPKEFAPDAITLHRVI